MPSSSADRNPVECLAEEFAERYRRGERPSLAEYVERYPQHADEIRELFPALVVMEQLKPVAADATGAYEGAGGPEGARLDHLGDYRILREVGRGGMGVVYEAEQVSLGRHVALKVLPRQALLNATYLERFRREAKAAARLHHTNIVPVFGVGECDGLHYYAMQFIRGEALDRVLHDLRSLREEPGAPGSPPTVSEESVARHLLSGRFAAPAEKADAPTVPEESRSSLAISVSGSEAAFYRGVARIGLQVAEALAYAHRHGILHRDVKPSNLLLDAQGTVWITDFGLAKAEGADELTHTGDVVGTVRFMAPERFDGHSLPQSDVYGLGVTLYELLTLRPAFDDANKARLIQRVLHEPPPPPCKRDPRIPRDLETVVLKCLAKEPAERYPTAEALADDLRRFLADRPIRARRTPWHERAWRWCRRNPGWAALLAVSLTLLTVMAVGGAVLNLQLRTALTQSRQAEQDRKKQVLESLVSQAKAQRLSGRAGQRFAALESIRKAAAMAREVDMPASTLDELRDLAIAALTRPDIRLVKEWEGWPEGSRSVVFDARLEHYARSDSHGNVTVRRVTDDVEVVPRPGDGAAVTLEGFDEDGRGLILVDSARTSRKRWRFDTSTAFSVERLPADLVAEDNWVARTADRKLVVTVNQKSGLLRVHEAASGKHLRDIPFGKWAREAGAAPPSNLFWEMHPWRHDLAISLSAAKDTEGTIVRILDLDRGTVQAELVADPRRGVGGVAWHPDGRTLAVAYTQQIQLWDVPTRTVFHAITEHKGGGLSCAFSRSGQLLSTYSSWTEGIKFWHPDSRKLLLSVPSANIQPSGQTPDGRLFTHRIRGTRLQLWTAEPSPILRLLVRGPARGPLGEYRRSSVHRDGRLLAVGTTHGVSLFDLAGGLDVGHLDLGYNLTAQFDPATGDLLTLGRLGLVRWPVRVEAGDPTRVRIGPPKQILATPASDNEFRISNDGRTIAVAQHSRVLVLHADRPDQPVILGPTFDVRQQISISPDGQWVATGGHWGGDVLVWEAGTGRVVKRQRVINGGSMVLFTPDGKRLLVTAGDRSWFWGVGDWREQGPESNEGEVWGWGEFSPGGRMLAWETGEGVLRLLDTTGGRILARLESPDEGRCAYTTFSPDGRLLITRNHDSQIIHVWDLHELRRQLKDLDLDWDAPPYPAAEARAVGVPTSRLEVEVDAGNMKRLTRQRQAAIQRNDEAWRLVTGPADKRDPARALELIQQAMRDDPDDPTLLNTLGVVQYRNGKYPEAVATLEKSLASGKGQFDAFDLFFLAMAHARLDNPAKARECFDQGVRWCEARKGLTPEHVEELKAFRAEAERVLRGPAPDSGVNP